MVGSLAEFATKLRNEKAVPIVQTEGSLREVHDAITEMLRQLANEPSVGLYFVQQHVHKAVPSMVSLKTQMVDNTREVEYVTQDVKDALNSVRSMKEVGPAVVERMIKTLDSSLPRLASLRPLKRVPSPQVPLEDISGRFNSAADYSGYVRTTFDSAFQKASSMASITKWNSYNRVTNLESTSTGGGEDFPLSMKSEAHTESNPKFSTQDVLDTAYSNPSRLEKTASEPSTGTSTSKEEISAAKDHQNEHDILDPLLGKTHSLPAFREVSDYSEPGKYVRAVLGSARQTAENVSREATKFLSADGKKSIPALDKRAEGWSWLEVPSKALRAFNKQPQTSEVQEASGDKVILDETSSSSRSEEEIQRLLEMEMASNEAFVTEQTAKLEEWLQDTEEDDRKTESIA